MIDPLRLEVITRKTGQNIGERSSFRKFISISRNLLLRDRSVYIALYARRSWDLNDNNTSV